MAKIKPYTLSGMMELLPAEQILMDQIMDTIRRSYAAFGFTALDISITEPVVLEALGTGKSRAYAIRDKVMKALEKELKKVEGADDPLFGRILLEMCEGDLSPAVRTQLGGAA